MGKFTPKEQSLFELLGPRVKYAVPKFQREYSWKSEKIDDFWTDVERNFQKSIKNPNDQDNSYYLGGVVILDDSENYEKLILVDGQQRFATITILLCLTRDWLKKIEEDEKSSPELKRLASEKKSRIENFIQMETASGELDDYKLELNERNKNFFRRLVLTPGIPEKKIEDQSKTENASEKNIFSCYESLNNKLQKFLETTNNDKIPQVLLEFVNLTLEFVTVISITVHREEDAFDIFETLNQRGQKLAIADLVKNLLLKNTSNTKRDHIDNNWRTMLSNLGDDPNIDQFLIYSWFSRRFFKNGKLIKNDLFKKIKEHNVDPRRVELYVDELLEDSEIYQAIIDPESQSEFWKSDSEIIKNLSGINTLDGSYVIPPIISAYRNYKSDFESLRSITRMILVYFFRYKIIGDGHANDVESLMIELSQNISGFDEEYNPKTYSIDELKNKLQSKIDIDDEFENQFKVKQIKKSSYLRYIFTEIEESLAGKRVEELRPVKKLTLEHVIPQKYEKWQPFFDEKKIINPETLVHRLGNMTILTKKMNSEIQDDVFDIKLEKAYKKSHFKLNEEIAEKYSEWTPKVITERQQMMAKKAKKIWKF